MLCPVRENMSGHMPECDKDCAWALVMASGSVSEGFTMSVRCAVAVGARALNDRVPDNAFMMIPFMEIDEEDE